MTSFRLLLLAALRALDRLHLKEAVLGHEVTWALAKDIELRFTECFLLVTIGGI